MRGLYLIFLVVAAVFIAACTPSEDDITPPSPRIIPEVEEITEVPAEPLPEETATVSNGTITVASFNIQVFGRTKRGKPDVMEVLKNTVRNFDVVAIQEVRDSSETTIPLFLSEINSMSGPRYDVVSGERVGRTSSKEKYAFLFNTETVNYTSGSAYTYDDTGDVFEREPFAAHFSSGVFDFVLINIHTKPDDAFSEINALGAVVEDSMSRFLNEQDFIVLGDFNADCTYFDETADTSALELAKYFWIIDDSADTTTKSTVCTYDRIVVTKTATFPDYANEWGVFRFDTEYGLNQTQTEAVSDHYPVWAVFHTSLDSD